jgi:hypothetical protein
MLLTLLVEEGGQGQEAAQLVCLPPHGSWGPDSGIDSFNVGAEESRFFA